jgi:hypothetical protein
MSQSVASRHSSWARLYAGTGRVLTRAITRRQQGAKPTVSGRVHCYVGPSPGDHLVCSAAAFERRMKRPLQPHSEPGRCPRMMRWYRNRPPLPNGIRISPKNFSLLGRKWEPGERPSQTSATPLTLRSLL